MVRHPLRVLVATVLSLGTLEAVAPCAEAEPSRFSVGAVLAFDGIPFGRPYLGSPTGVSGAYRAGRWLSFDAAVGVLGVPAPYAHLEALLTLPLGPSFALYVGAGGFVDSGTAGVRVPIGFSVLATPRLQIFGELAGRSFHEGTVLGFMGGVRVSL